MPHPTRVRHFFVAEFMHTSITQFFAAWGETSAETRESMLSACLSDSALAYTDPRMSEPLSAAAELIDYIAQFSQNAPGWIARPVESTHSDGTHTVTVSFEGPDGTAQMGVYEIETDVEGRLTRIHGVKA